MPPSVYDVARTQEMMMHLVLCLRVSDQLLVAMRQIEAVVMKHARDNMLQLVLKHQICQ